MLLPMGVTHWGTVCSTWVWMCRATTKRSWAEPLGDTSLECVTQANIMVSRCALLFYLVEMVQGLVILEQPGSSIMFRHPRLLNRGMCEVFTWMGAFGAPSAKPTKLLSNNRKILRPLAKQLKREDREHLCSKDMWTKELNPNDHASMSVTGLKGLKQSQDYPWGYAQAVATSYSAWHGRLASDLAGAAGAEAEDNNSSDSDYASNASDAWEDAALHDVAGLLS